MELETVFYGIKRPVSQRNRAKGQRSKGELVRKERKRQRERKKEREEKVIEREMSCENLVSSPLTDVAIEFYHLLRMRVLFCSCVKAFCG